ncbi:glycosyltransferase family 2 protein [Novosphingobium beihaiensis]|uniref:Glycosyltransferase n=1 Tax=Novosphingobium beihaiensis TaxID=2930389 RepID=A0ABT0BTI6_9SPHN|nr:glycosyltransferase [Novosphingobium beihaiensis]MCJ2188351.1 glycosyltransferase [Novosphingobium beihaiensis]
MSSLYDREVFGATREEHFRLRLQIKGSAEIALLHTDHTGHRRVVATAHSGGGKDVYRYPGNYLISDATVDPYRDEHEVTIPFNLVTADSGAGRWSFMVTPLFGAVEVLAAEWEIGAAPLREICPAFVICTFNRVAQLQANLATLSGILDAETSDWRVIVVDNARTFTVQASLATDRIQVIAQKNVGGAGGFGRGIHIALDTDATSHIVLLDDDADIDAVSIARMLNIFRFQAQEEDFIGGVQMDVYDPLKLADASAYWRADRFETVEARMPPSRLDSPEGKNALARNMYTNFNGWWLFGGSKTAFLRNGMPLPIFVHLDDVDYGVRADIAGRRTWTVPGIAVWHEPYYAKVEGWFAFYNIRNELIRLSGHLPRMIGSMIDEGYIKKAKPQRALSKRLKRVEKQLQARFRNFISTNQYGSAYLLSMAVERFLDGPAPFRTEDFDAVHQQVMAQYKRFNQNYRKLDRLPVGRMAATPSTAASKIYRFVQRRTFNGHKLPQLKSSPFRRLVVFPERMDISWTGIPLQSDFAYTDPDNGSLHYFGFNPDVYGEISEHFNKVIKRYIRECGRVGPQWADAYDDIISREYWNKLIASFD